MFTEPHSFLPKQHGILARHARHSAMAETIVSIPLHAAGKSDSRSLDGSLNEAIAALGMDGAVEFIGAGFRVQAPGPR